MNTQQNQPKILNYKNLSLDKYEYLLPHKTQNGYYQSVCNYRLSKNQVLPFYFETPKLKTTSGIVRIDNKFYMDLELPQSGDGGLFYQFLLKNDENNISICHENAKEWFNQVMPLNIVENYYKTPILLKSNGQLPIIRIRLPSYKGNILTEIFNIRKEKLNNISCIQEGDYIVGIIEFVGLTFMSQNFTPCYELQKIKIFKDNDTRVISSGYLFSDMNDQIDLDNNDMEMDNMLEQPIENILNFDDDIKDIIRTVSDERQNVIPNIKMQNNKISNVKLPEVKTQTPEIKTIEITPKKKSLYDVIKETTFKDFLFDDLLFMNNNKLITNKNKPEVPILNQQIPIKQVTIQQSNIQQAPIQQAPIQQSPIQQSPILDSSNINIAIQNNIKNIDLNLDYELESPTSTSPNRSVSPHIDYEHEQNSIHIDDEVNIEIDDNGNDNISIEECEEGEEGEEGEEELDNEEELESDQDLESDSESDNGIDYNTLNDLEVIMFE